MLKRYIWLAYILLLTLAVALGTEIVTTYIDAKQAVPLVEKLSQSRQAPMRQTPATFANDQVIVKRNIFNANPPQPSPSEPPVIVPQEIQATQLRLELAGTANDANGQRYAIIADLTQGGDQNLYQPGDAIQNAILVEINRDCVVLERNGQHESLCLVHEAVDIKAPRQQPPPSSTRATPPTPAVVDPDIVQVDATTWRVSRDRFLVQFETLRALQVQAFVLPYGARQKPRGVLLTRLRPDSLLRKSGFQDGDVLQSVNGLRLTIPNQIPQAFQQLQNESTIRLEILRRNRATTLTYELR